MPGVFGTALKFPAAMVLVQDFLRERSVQIYGSTPRVIDRSQWGTGSTYDSANKVGSHPADAALASRGDSQSSDATRNAAVSALHNERFGSMLQKLSDPQASDAMMQMQRSDGADHASAFAAYGENGV
jgi:hypothetical protein